MINIFPQNQYMVETRKYMNFDGIVRLNVNRLFDRVGTMYEKKNFFDCKGIQQHQQSTFTDFAGNAFPIKTSRITTQVWSILPTGILHPESSSDPTGTIIFRAPKQ